jgi:hypothetical protein
MITEDSAEAPPPLVPADVLKPPAPPPPPVEPTPVLTSLPPPPPPATTKKFAVNVEKGLSAPEDVNV